MHAYLMIKEEVEQELNDDVISNNIVELYIE